MPRRLPSPPDTALSRRHWLALAGSATLTACGGGGSTPEDAPALVRPLGVATGGTGRIQSFLSAAVSATTPLVVGGVTLDTRDAEISDGDGETLRLQELAPGMTARVLAGSIVTGAARAVAVTVDTQVAGPATWLDSRTLLVLGQRVSVSSSAVRGPGAAGTPQEVRVWGRLDFVGGRIVASRLAVRTPTVGPMLRGVLTSVDRSAGWLQVGPLVARAVDGGAIPSGLAEGAVVRLTLGEPLPDGSWQLLAARDDALRPPDGLKVELEGQVTQFSSARQFALDGVPVNASRAQIEGMAQLQLGATAGPRHDARGRARGHRGVGPGGRAAGAGRPHHRAGCRQPDLPAQRLAGALGCSHPFQRRHERRPAGGPATRAARALAAGRCGAASPDDCAGVTRQAA